jgi:hypothetical protein
MIEEFKHLDESEQDLLFMVPVWVSILIAGADNNVDKKELKSASQLAQTKIEEGSDITKAYFAEVAATFENNMKGYMALLPKLKEERSKVIISKLEALNDIFPKLDREFAIELYRCLKEFALNVAQASGGVFGLFSISDEEGKFLNLNMIKDPAKLP